MIIRKLFLVFGILFFFSCLQIIKAQSSNVGIALNEYAASNVYGPADNFGQLSDWVELYNLHTSPVSLAGYYLSNDRLNKFKWKFPSNFTMGVGEYKVVWLSGRNTVAGGAYHANFTLDQSKNQWLILSTSDGTVRDSVPVLPCKAGHTRGRVDYSSWGVEKWKLYTTHSYLQPNPTINNYIDYLPKPSLYLATPNATAAAPNYTTKINTGDFNEDGAQIYNVYINGIKYDTSYTDFKCFNIFYTTNGDYPTAGNWTQYYDTITGIIAPRTAMIRVIAVPVVSSGTFVTTCPNDYLDSFCETNTYFVNSEHQTFDSRFGVLSIALDRNDTTWFNSQGIPSSTTVHVEYYDNKKQVSEGYAIINRPPNETWLTKQRGFYISIDDRYGFGANFEGNIFNVKELGTSTRTVFPTLHVKGGDFESLSASNAGPSDVTNGTGLRDVFYQTLAIKYNLNVKAMHFKPIITFVNGNYWGVYNLAEVYDKYYESYYNGQPENEMDLCFYNNGDASVSYPDGSVSTYNNNFRSQVYDKASQLPLTSSAPNSNYDKIIQQIDKASFMDYMIMNSYAMNSDLWNYNIAFARGSQSNKPGGKWHYYLWNAPAIFNYTAIATNTLTYSNPQLSPCFIFNVAGYGISPKAHNAHGQIMKYLQANKDFTLEYRNRYLDLMNGPLKCDNILKHFQDVDTVYKEMMHCHEDPGCAAGPGKFATQQFTYDTNMVRFKRRLVGRCYEMETLAFSRKGCFSLTGPFGITVDVTPAGAGNVKVNSLWLDSYPWHGSYYQTQMSFKAAPTSTNYVFHHWEFKNHTPKNPLSSDSVVVQSWSTNDEVLAVFTDLTLPFNSQNIPNAFTPNGDSNNDYFRPLGSAEFATEYQITIWNRWGQEVYRNTDPTALGWDGKYNGQDAPTGVYAYVITYKNIYGESKIVKDNLTLTR